MEEGSAMEKVRGEEDDDGAGGEWRQCGPISTRSGLSGPQVLHACRLLERAALSVSLHCRQP
jgi:hypothetical protein